MSDLGTFQDNFARTLSGEGGLEALGDPSALSAGFSVYRNTVAKGRLDALRANYPTVERLVGPDWFEACARIFAHARPPSEPSLLAYGEGFGNFLDGFPPAAALPYLSDVARIDRLWSEAHLAPDAEALTAGRVAELAPDQLFALAPGLHPAVRFAWFKTPAPTIWLGERPGGEMAAAGFDIELRAEGLLLTRPGDAVVPAPIDRAGYTFLRVCAEAGGLGHAAAATLEESPGADVAGLFAGLIARGAFPSAESN